jgi:hypothetical protein
MPYSKEEIQVCHDFYTLYLSGRKETLKNSERSEALKPVEQAGNDQVSESLSGMLKAPKQNIDDSNSDDLLMKRSI